MLGIDLNTLKFSRGLVISLLIFALLVPGYSTIFFFERELFFSLDLLRLTIFALTITFPVLVSYLISEAISHANSISKSSQEIIFIPPSIYTFVSFYIGIAFKYFINISNNHFIIIILCSIIIVLLNNFIFFLVIYCKHIRRTEFIKMERHKRKQANLKVKIFSP